MDMDAVRRVMRRVSEVLPAWLQWRQDTLLAQSRFAGEPETAAAGRRMLELWQRNLGDVTEAEAGQVLDRLAVGQLAAPPYGELPVWLRRESLALRPTAEAERRELQYAAEPRFRCLHCQDRGMAHAIDPRFTRAFRNRVEAMTQADFDNTDGGTWWIRAKRWYAAEHGIRKIDYSVACCCTAGDRFADRHMRLVPQQMPVLHGSLWHREALTEWYAAHDASEVQYWAVPDFAEAE